MTMETLAATSSHFAPGLGELFSMDCLNGSIGRLPLGVSRQPLLIVILKTTTLFGIGYLRSVLLIADTTLFPGSITAMTTASGAAKVKRANWSGFCRSSRHAERSHAERKHGEFQNEFFRVHTSILLSNEQILTRQKEGGMGDVQFFCF